MPNSRSNDKYRKFTDLPTEFANNLEDVECSTDSNQLFDLVANSEIGSNQRFLGPFGSRQIHYCDYTATGRGLSFIEDFIRDEVLAEYGNTHTSNTVTSLQTTLFRNEARDIVRNSVNACERDMVIFVGAGCTGAVAKLVHGLNLEEPPIVFVSPFEHHSNLLPWRELFAEMVYVDENNKGEIDLDDLEAKLKKYSDRSNRKIGAFSAASNVTGILTDTNKISIMLHKYNALAFWDYATAAPYVQINMNPFVDQDQEFVYKDAIYFSMHKFIGGASGSPGILIAKKSLFKNPVPQETGGGTVFYVTKYDHRYLKNEELREEAGTPSIVGDIRAGLLFQLKTAIGIQNIMNREKLIAKKAIEFMSQIKNLILLGSLKLERLPLFSFLIKNEQTGYYLHSNFVTALLNDLFGIQTRSGCACAGPYSQYLLGIDYELAKSFEETLVQDDRLDRNHLRIKHDTSSAEILRPGFVRFSLGFFFDDEKIDFILNCIKFVCENGWKFLPFYSFNLETGEWRHRSHQVYKDRKWLGNINYKNGQFNYNKTKSENLNKEVSCPLTYQDYFDSAYKALEEIKTTLQLSDQRLIFGPETSKLRWFLMPSEAYGLLHSIKSLYDDKIATPVFVPRKYDASQNELDMNENMINESQNHAINDQKFSDFVQEIDSFNQIDHFVKLVRNETKKKINQNGHKIEKLNDHAKPKTKENLVCTINKTVKEQTNSFKFTQKWVHPPKVIFKPFVKAVEDFNMIQNNDKILIALSGGKDSLSLLQTMKQYQYFCRSKNINFDFGCVTIDPKTPSYNPSSLKEYLAELGVPYFYEEQCIMDSAAEIDVDSICSFCSRMKRGRIYHTARKNGYNVLALGHHLDDFAESFMMSIFYNGKLHTMKCHYKNEEGDLRIIRPLVYVREKDLRTFAETNHLPIIAENCPACFEAPKERMRIKHLLAQQELNFSTLFSSLLNAIRPIISINKCQLSIKSLSEHALKLVQNDPELYTSLTTKNDKNEHNED